MSFAAVVVAGGRGERFGQKKHLVQIDGRALWAIARDTMLESGADPVVVVGDVPDGVEGGPRRRDSVAAGLAVLPEGVSTVLVHDSARPLATASLVGRLIDRLSVGDVAGVVPAVPVADATKRVLGDVVVATVNRAGLFAVQTPQAFDLAFLRTAHAADDTDAADDAELVERAGGSVAIVEGNPSNIKVTYRNDLIVARALWKDRA